MAFADSTGLSMCHIHSPNIILTGLGFFVYFRLFSHQTEHILLLCFLHICFDFLSFTFCHLKREIFSKPLCLIGLSVPQESQIPQSVSILFWGPFTGQSPGSEGGSRALGRVTQSEHNRDPAPGLLSRVCYSLQALVVPLKDSLTLNPLWDNTINIMENCDCLRIKDCWW